LRRFVGRRARNSCGSSKLALAQEIALVLVGKRPHNVVTDMHGSQSGNGAASC
jgi:hypothetical protein